LNSHRQAAYHSGNFLGKELPLPTGRRATDAHVQELRKALLRGASRAQAALRADMDRKTARKYRDQPELPSPGRRPRTWRTRADPLAALWPQLEELLGREPGLQAKTLLEWLQREHPGPPWERSRRTLERRGRPWRAQHGPAKEVFFAQVHEPGRWGASDFSHMDALGVTIQGQPFPHLVYHFVLTYSNWEHVSVCFSESFASLSEGLQNALGELGGVPQRHRTDRMTLAVHHEGSAEQYTATYRALLAHYGLEPEATKPASGHENGDCEHGHRRFKEAVEQALLLRGSRDFASRAAYRRFLHELAARRNAGRQEKLAAERACLRPLPAARLEAVERQRVKVSRGSTIRVKHHTYSVPTRLMGEAVEVRVGAEQVEVWYAGALVQTMERLRGQDKHHIDYRHISSWLVRKPGAFARYVYREDL
jgi:transposase